MIRYLIIVIYLIFFTICIYNLILRNKKNNFIGAYSGIALGLIFYYIFIPIIINIFYLAGSEINKYYNNHFTTATFYDYLNYFFMFAIGFLSFTVAYDRVKDVKPSNWYKNNTNYSESKYIDFVGKVAWSTLIIGGLSLIIFVVSFGGVIKVLSIVEARRSFVSGLSNYGNFFLSLFSIPARIITVAPYLFLFLLFNRKNKSDLVCFLISIIFSIYYLVFNGGKAPLLSFLLVFVYMRISKCIKKSWTVILSLSLLFLPILGVLDNIFTFLSYGVWLKPDINFMKYILMFSFPHLTSLNVLKIVNKFGFRFGRDFLTAILNLLPNVNFSISYEATSEYFSGLNWKQVGGVPNDLLSFSYQQLSLLGVVLICILLGVLAKKIDLGLELTNNKNSSKLFSSIIAINCFFLIQNADFEPFIRSNFILIIVSYLLIRMPSIKHKQKVKI